MYNFYQRTVQPADCTLNFPLTMKLTFLLLIAGILQVSAETYAQKVSLTEKSTPLKAVFDKISDQTGYDFLISTENIRRSRPVTISLKDTEIQAALEQIFREQPLNFIIQDKMVIVTAKTFKSLKTVNGQTNELAGPVRGKVTDSTGLGLAGTIVRIQGTTQAVQTDPEGNFAIAAAAGNELIISFLGYEEVSVKLKANQPFLAIVLRTSASRLNEIQIIGYGTTTRRLSTGSQSSIKAADIANQPVTNALSALSGRMPGVFIQTTNGLPGGNINVQIRGKGSIQAGTDPLYIIDGVPFPSAVVPAGNVIINSSINGSISPMNSINPADIESITVLKDADATSIYGSRGSNGVVLITTKKGKAGATRTTFNLSQGISRIANAPPMLDLDQYLTIRKEAFKNDGISPTAANAPDLLVWDTTRTTDWNHYFFGGTGKVTDLLGDISGGNAQTNFTIGGSFRQESTVLPGDNTYQRGGLRFSLQHRPAQSRFSLFLSGSYNADNNRLTNIVGQVASALILPPDYPLYDVTGNYNWNISSPIAAQQATSKIKTDNLVTNLILQYNLSDALNVKITGGYNNIRYDQTEIFPTTSLFPGTINYTYFGTNAVRSAIIEPQLNYRHVFGNSTLTMLAGATYQSKTAPGQTTLASNFTTQALMENMSSAGTITLSNAYAQYKYLSFFGRLTYNIDDTYIINATARRDGSSRFGPENRFGNFGSLGAAWLFSNETWLKDRTGPLSYGKLRVSYGLTGNDQIPDYQYLSTYGNSANYNYQTFAALVPTRIANYQFHWETTKKLDLALELGFFRDRLLLTLEHYRNSSDDQLVAYAIPYLTGFATYQANLPAVVENRGWEIGLNTQQIDQKDFKWSSNFNLTVPRNQLKSFDNFATSSYAQTLQVGYDITRITGYQMTGVDPSTGKASYAAQDGTPSATPYLYHTLGKQTPDLYGGIGNTFTFKQWQLDIFAQFAKQAAKGGLFTSPGLKFNNYTLVIDRWMKPGDQTNIPKASTTSDAYFTNSNVNFFDASYFRLKNVALSYTFPTDWLKRTGLKQLRLYAQGQNLWTIRDQKAALLDPESGPLTSAIKNIPPMRTIAIGLQTSF